MAAGQGRRLSAHAGRTLLGPLPNIYPFIVNDPGEGAQAKRRTQAVIIDHLMPPLTRAETYGPCAIWSSWPTSTTKRSYSTRVVPELQRDILELVKANHIDRELSWKGSWTTPSGCRAWTPTCAT
jgi:cobaltochelatase CobN